MSNLAPYYTTYVQRVRSTLQTSIAVIDYRTQYNTYVLYDELDNYNEFTLYHVP